MYTYTPQNTNTKLAFDMARMVRNMYTLIYYLLRASQECAVHTNTTRKLKQILVHHSPFTVRTKYVRVGFALYNFLLNVI